VTRELAHEPLGCRPKVLKNTTHRHRCIDCRCVWRHAKHCDKYVTVVNDLTPIREGTGPARLLGVVEGRSKKAFMSWIPSTWPSWPARRSMRAGVGSSRPSMATAAAPGCRGHLTRIGKLCRESIDYCCPP
jgi:hypothetical protein